MPTKKAWRDIAIAALVLFLALPADGMAALGSTATDWNNFFGADGYIIPYTYKGQPIADEEGEGATSPSAGGSSVAPANIDLSSGSPNGTDPGPYATPFYGYYNGGTAYDPADVSTMMDDFIMFRIRIQANPADKSNNPDGFKAYHWNVLFDIDRDGYKEYWVDLDGSGNGSDNLRILYNNDATQLVDDPAAAEVEVFTARADEESPIGTSHSRTFPAGDGSGDYFIDLQAPMWAFDDLLGNQLFFPDSPVAFIYSTGASNTDPLQKDYMMDIDYLSDIDPITFGDVVIANGQPDVYFIDSAGESAEFYTVGDSIYMRVSDVLGNTGSTTNETIIVTVTNPATLDDETVTLVETGPDTGVFTNLGGAGAPISSNPAEGWLPFVETASSVGAETWTLTYNSGPGNWTVTGSVSGAQGTASAGTSFTSANGDVTFTVYEDNPSNGDTVTFATLAGDTLTSSATAGIDDDTDMEIAAGDEIQFSYNPSGTAHTDSADIVGPNEPFMEFTRSTGLPNSSFELTTNSATSDLLYVTVTHGASNTDPNAAEEITVYLTDTDGQQMGPSTDPDGSISAYVLVETGPDTGIFRNAAGLPTQVSGGAPVADDGLWEGVDQGIVTATFTYLAVDYTTSATLFYTDTAGRANFTNGAGTVGVERYSVDQPIFVQVTDNNACTTTVGGIETVTAVVTSPAGDSEALTLYETAAGNGTFMNRTNDLVTTAVSAVVTSASSTFVTDGVTGGDPFVIATGPDAGSYIVASVGSETQLTLTAALSASRTDVGFSATPLLAASFDGAAAADDNNMEATHGSQLTLSYGDCDDGDVDAGNDTKTDTAVYNAPPIVINEVFFYPEVCGPPYPDPGCPAQDGMTEYVMLYNNSTAPENVTGYTVSDEDGWSYTVPQVGGSDLSLLPGEKIYILLYQKDLSHRDFYQSGTYYLFADHGMGSTVMPSDVFADPEGADPADQLTLTDSSSAIADYVGWSSTVTPSLDFLGDDSGAVIAGIWGDDSYRDVTSIAVNGAISRVADGYDTDQPSDWIYATNSPFAVVVTSVMVTSFEAATAPGGIALRWETAQEEGTVGFNLYRKPAESSGEFVPVNRKLLPAVLVSVNGGSYGYVDRGASAGKSYLYLLEEIDRTGARQSYGPFPVKADTAVPAAAAPFGRQLRNLSPRQRDIGFSTAANEPRAVAMPAARTATAKLKIAVTEDGFYGLSAARIAALTGESLARVRERISSYRLRLTSGRQEIPWFREKGDRGIVFYGTGRSSMTADENIYWLSKGPQGVKVAGVDSPPRSKAAADTFSHTLHIEEDVWGIPLFFDDPTADYFVWDYVVAGYAGHDEITVPFEVGEVLPEGSGEVAVHIVGGSVEEGGSHHAAVAINGFAAGVCTWQEREQTCRFSFSQGILKEGGNNLSVRGHLNGGAAYSIFYLDSFDVRVTREARAAGDTLLFTTEGKKDFVVRDFTHRHAAILDVTNPYRPAVIRGRTAAGAGGYDVFFRTLPGERTYFVAAKTALRHAEVTEVWNPTSLKSSRNRADYLIITPRDFMDAATPLAEHRRAQGLMTRVVAVEDVMNEFNGGFHGPDGIRRFLRRVHRAWQRSPRYVLLAGDGSWDYRDLGGSGDSLVPPALVATPDGLTVSDTALADVAGTDGVPEFAVGRLPARTPDELRLMTDKIIDYESGWGDKAIFMSDKGDGAGDFPRNSNAIAAMAKRTFDLELIYLTGYTPDGAKSRLESSMNDEVRFLNFIGHGAPDRLSQEGLMKAGELDSLFANGGQPVLTAMTCAVGQFAIPGYDSLAETLLLHGSGGAAAVWAPSGYSLNKEAFLLGRSFYGALGSGSSAYRPARSLRLGDVIGVAQREFSAAAGPVFMLNIYNLLGDPAMLVRQAWDAGFDWSE